MSSTASINADFDKESLFIQSQVLSVWNCQIFQCNHFLHVHSLKRNMCSCVSHHACSNPHRHQQTHCHKWIWFGSKHCYWYPSSSLSLPKLIDRWDGGEISIQVCDVLRNRQARRQRIVLKWAQAPLRRNHITLCKKSQFHILFVGWLNTQSFTTLTSTPIQRTTNVCPEHTIDIHARLAKFH